MLIQRFPGFWNGNPATPVPLSPGDTAPLDVEIMGGSDKVLATGRELRDSGEYMLAKEILNRLFLAGSNELRDRGCDRLTA